jgi:SpoVK/Ycf46/Vps4 family AAA+-type ATPase
VLYVFYFVQVSRLDYDKLADIADGFSGSDLHEACRAAAVTTVHQFLQEEKQGGTARYRN